jgi:hypothetical protein
MTGLLKVVGGLSALTAASCLLVLGASSAAAAPGNGSKWETFPLTCNADTFTITASPGQWSVGHIVGENGMHVVPYSFSITVTDLVTGETLLSASYIKPGDRGGDTVLCSDHSQRPDPATGHMVAIDFSSLVRIRGN